jgi:hypothetical protein
MLARPRSTARARNGGRAAFVRIGFNGQRDTFYLLTVVNAARFAIGPVQAGSVDLSIVGKLPILLRRGAAVSYCKDLFRRLRGSLVWVALQFVLTLVLILIALAWTRLPDKHLWQVALALLTPLLLAISALELEAGTMRAFADDDGRRVKLVWGAMTLLAWVALFWACWAVLDWCDARIPEWAGYLSSRASAGEQVQHWLKVAEWVLRWIVVPGKIIAYSTASAQWGWRLPFRKIIRLLLNWRWWSAVVLASVVSVVLPGHFFAGFLQDPIARQVWEVAATYVLAVGCWVSLLAWAAVLLGRDATESGVEVSPSIESGAEAGEDV